MLKVFLLNGVQVLTLDVVSVAWAWCCFTVTDGMFITSEFCFKFCRTYRNVFSCVLTLGS